MIADLKPYPAYKDSGVPWLGDVPEHWHIPRLGALLRERGETNSDGKIIEVLSVLRGRGVIPYSEKGNIGNKKSEDITRYKVVRQDDIVMNSMNVIIGSVGISRYTGCLSPVYYVMTRRSLKDNPRYINAYFQTTPFQKSLVRIGNGILAHRMRIPMELLKCEPFPHPPPDEQSAIVQFLDHADRKIRRYIRAKQKLIKLLEEQRIVVTHDAINSKATYREQLKRVSRLVYRRVEREKGVLYKPIGLYNRGRGIFHKPLTEGENLGDSEFFWVNKRDVVISGQFAWEGAVAIAGEDDDGCIASHRYPILQPVPELIVPEYLFSFLQTKEGAILLNQHNGVRLKS